MSELKIMISDETANILEEENKKAEILLSQKLKDLLTAMGDDSPWVEHKGSLKLLLSPYVHTSSGNKIEARKGSHAQMVFVRTLRDLSDQHWAPLETALAKREVNLNFGVFSDGGCYINIQDPEAEEKRREEKSESTQPVRRNSRRNSGR